MIKYNSSTSNKRIVLFYYDRFDPSKRGTIVDSKYSIANIQMDRRYVPFDSFIITRNARQMYYIPYPTSHIYKRG